MAKVETLRRDLEKGLVAISGAAGIGTATIIEPAPITATMEDVLLSCNGDNTGELRVTRGGGTVTGDYA